MKDVLTGHIPEIYIKVSFSWLRRLDYHYLWPVWEDLQQTCRLSAVEAYKFNLSVKEAYNLAGRNLHACLKELGYRRGRAWKGYSKREWSIEDRDLDS